ncbi:hypothetical protein [Lacunimicrobium album]
MENEHVRRKILHIILQEYLLQFRLNGVTGRTVRRAKGLNDEKCRLLSDQRSAADAQDHHSREEPFKTKHQATLLNNTYKNGMNPFSRVSRQKIKTEMSEATAKKHSMFRQDNTPAGFRLTVILIPA